MAFQGYMKGANIGGWLSQYAQNAGTEHFASYISQKDIQQIASWGADHIRLPVDSRTLLEKDGLYQDDGFYFLDKAIDWCRQSGLNIIIDLHEAPGFNFMTPDYNRLMDSDECQSQMIDLWETIAKRYKSETNHVSYELLNEVNDQTPDRWNSLTNRLVKKIREIDERPYIIVGGIQANAVDQLANLGRFDDDKIVYTFHMYHPFIFTHQRADFTPLGSVMDMNVQYPVSKQTYADTLRQIASGFYKQESDNQQKNTQEINMQGLTVQGFGAHNQKMLLGLENIGKEYVDRCMESALAFIKESDLPVYCGEFGAIINADPTSRTNWIRDVVDFFLQHDIGYAVWNYKEKHFPLVNMDGTVLDTDYIKAIFRENNIEGGALLA